MNSTTNSLPDAPSTSSQPPRNPFTLPSDEEVFRLRDEEKKRRADNRDNNTKLKIWQKGGGNGGRSLRMKEIGKGKKSNNAATGVINERRQEKEIMTEFIAKKREMFLVQMSLDTKREEIRKLEEKAQMKEEALQKSETMLEEDAIRFDTFLKENDKKAHEAIKKAEKETKLKTDKVQEIKKLNQQIQMVQSDMSKHKEALEDCLKYKDFLDKLTPQEWFEQQESHKKDRSEKRRQTRIEVKKEEWEKKKKEIYQEAIIRHEAETKAKDGKKDKRKSRRRNNNAEGGGPVINVNYPPAPDFEQEPYTSSGEEMPMYFTHPQQLLDVFIALEEQNLFLIQNSQETEQALEDLKTSYRETRKKMDQKTSSLEENIFDLKNQISGEENKKSQLARRIAKSAGHTQEKQEALLQSLGEKVKEVYQRCGFDSSSNPSTLFMLSDLEAQLEDLLSALELMPEDYVKKVEKEKEKKRRELKRIEQQAAQEAKQAEKNKLAVARAMQPPPKRVGRQVMYRSQPVRRKVKQEAKTETQEELDELKFFT
ncbi:hypothetical protein TrLO_g11103 [Triparma laevis f. longispina]|uniref:DUF4200 domain-containing protein n=1 Tax=Triparma laevis f. longispina TaxID=1714387 RepID=A0A9W7C9D1_9STRA|nr:hypothetical protein TrLO_g11103 [Triparma laevis f. longispina]